MRNMRWSGILVLLIIFSSLFSFMVHPSLRLVTQHQEQIMNNTHIPKDSLTDKPKAKLIVSQADAPEYLGKYIRNKDYTTVNGTLIDQDTGDPISGATIKLYLDNGDNVFNAQDDIYLASNVTDNNGVFYFRILVDSNFREGNNTLIAHFEGGIIGGNPYGPDDAFYILTVYIQAKIGISFASKRLALFERNVSCNVWIYSDNGTRLAIENLTINMTVIFSNSTHTFTVDNRQLITGSDGFNHTYIPFNYVGNYTVQLTFNVTENKDYLGNFTVSEQQYFDKGALKGDPTSYTEDRFEVYEAVKFVLWFEEAPDRTSLDAYKNGTEITISGLFYNTTGDLDTATIIVDIYNVELHKNEPIHVDAVNGAFSLTVNVAPENNTGSYLITARDKYPTTVDLTTELQLLVRSKMRIEITNFDELTSNIYPAGTIIGISGRVSDLYSAEGIPNVNIKFSFDGINGSEINNSTVVGGNFYVRMKIPDFVPYSTLTLRLEAEESAYYDGTSSSLIINVFNMILTNITINESFYAWGISRSAIQMFTESTEYVAEENETISIKLDITDDFGRKQNAQITILAGNVTLLTTEANSVQKTLKVNSSSFYLYFRIYIPSIDDTLEIAIFIKVRPKTRISPTSLVIPAIILGIIGSIIIVSLLAERRGESGELGISTTVAGRMQSARVIIQHIEDSFIMDNIVEAISQGGRLLLQMARELRGSYPIWMTLREIANYILEEFSHPIKETIREALLDLILVYEKVVYGHKKPTSNDIERFRNAIEIIKKYIIPRLEGASHG